MNDRFSADDLSRAAGGTPRVIDLAHTPAFQIGPITVRPAARELVRGERRETLEPLVMQVLIALYSARGATLSRDDLVDACWGGRAVSDDAISRVVSRLRALGNSLGGFTVETMPKIGYRLLAEQAPETTAPAVDRRRMLWVSGAAAAAAGIGYWKYRSATPRTDPAEADQLLQKGLAVLQNNDIIEAPDPGTSLQALALLTAATDAAPQSAIAWGALAVAFSVRKRAVGPADRPGLEARARAAAGKALALDPTEARALAALRLIEPNYHNWIAAERGHRDAFAKNSQVAILGAIMSNFLGGVGRWREAASYTKGIDRRRFVIPGVEWRLLIDLWSSGDLQAADRQLEFATERWPQHARVWRTGLTYLMYSGRPAEALRFLANDADTPIEIRPEFVENVRVTAEALAGQRATSEAVAANLDYVRSTPSAALQAAQSCVALGKGETALGLLDGYYFGAGEWAALAPPGGDEDRITSPLFQPVMAPLWPQPAFQALLRRTGLEDYWLQSGTQPDFRRFG